MSLPPSQDNELIAAARADGLGTVIDIAGIDKAMELLRLRRGQIISIPQRPGPDHWLTLALGPEATRKLAWYYGGTHLRIPMGRSVKILQRDREIMALHGRGMSCLQIAMRFSCTDRTVREVLARQRVRPAQPIATVKPVVPGFSRQQIDFLSKRLEKEPAEVIALLKPEPAMQTNDTTTHATHE